MMKLTENVRESLINGMEELIDGGTILSIDEVVKSLLGVDTSQLDKSVLNEIDTHFFVCQSCDWTYPSDELSFLSRGESICLECAEEEE